MEAPGPKASLPVTASTALGRAARSPNAVLASAEKSAQKDGGASEPPKAREAQAVVEPSPPAEQRSHPSEAGRGCGDARPAWVDLPPCERDGVVYATGAVRGVKDLSLARSAAADRARAALVRRSQRVKGGSRELRGSEVLDVFECRGRMSALARVQMPSASTAKLPACEPSRLESRSSASDCPDWTQRVAWKQGGQISAVGVAKLNNRALAEAAATNRARAELARLGSISTRESADGLTRASAAEVGKSPAEVARKHASCGGYVYVMLVANAAE